MRQGTILAAATITTVLTVAAPTSFAALSQSQTDGYAGYVNVTIAGTNDRDPNPTDGSLAGQGHLQGAWRYNRQRESARLSDREG